jgi:hypothetical protein
MERSICLSRVWLDNWREHSPNVEPPGLMPLSGFRFPGTMPGCSIL